MPSPVERFFGVTGLTDAHVVAERDEIDRVLQHLPIGVGDIEGDAGIAQLAQEVARVGAADVDVAERQVVVIGFHDRENVLRVGRQRINGHRDDHATDLNVGIDLVGDLGGRGRSNELVVDGLVEVGLRELVLGRPDTCLLYTSPSPRD